MAFRLVDRNPPPKPLKSGFSRASISNAFDSYTWGDPGVSLAQLRDDYKEVAQLTGKKNKSPWRTDPLQVARCLILGVDPNTGADIPNPDAYVAEFSQYREPDANADVKMYYERFKGHPRIQQDRPQILPTEPPGV